MHWERPSALLVWKHWWNRCLTEWITPSCLEIFWLGTPTCSHPSARPRSIVDSFTLKACLLRSLIGISYLWISISVQLSFRYNGSYSHGLQVHTIKILRSTASTEGERSLIAFIVFWQWNYCWCEEGVAKVLLAKHNQAFAEVRNVSEKSKLSIRLIQILHYQILSYLLSPYFIWLTFFFTPH